MFDRVIDSTEVQPQRGSSSRSSCGSTHRRRMKQDSVNEKMEQRLRENEEYNMQVQEYYRQEEEQRDMTFGQQQQTLQVSMIVNNRLSEN
jgi:sensor histidine kinase YesM